MSNAILPKWANPSPEEINFVQSMHTVAQLLAQEQTPPSWIRDVFSHFAWRLGSTWTSEKLQKTRKATLEWAERVEMLSTELDLSLQNAHQFEYLGDGDATEPGWLTESHRFLNRVSAIARRRRQYVAPEGSLKRGVGKAAPLGWISPQQECAIIVTEVWAAFYGEYPPGVVSRYPIELADLIRKIEQYREKHRKNNDPSEVSQ
ncbi:MAG: hypothetical protein Q7N95_15835 [Alphaproteobacteria bacterium]|nr:hypothetical protein [Alphaproteobacteria bacterium]